jgi:hypothetical protein
MRTYYIYDGAPVTVQVVVRRLQEEKPLTYAEIINEALKTAELLNSSATSLNLNFLQYFKQEQYSTQQLYHVLSH